MSILDNRRGGNGGNDHLAPLEAGLDALETTTAPRRDRGRKIFAATWPPVLAIIVLLGIWELVYRAGVKPSYALPSPADVGAVLREQLSDGTLFEAMRTSLSRGGIGFLIAVLIGTPLGLLIARVQPVRRGIGPLASGLHSLPSVAWVPAAIIFFGIGETAIYAVVLLGATPSIANGMVSGIHQVPPLYTRVGRVLGAKGLSAARHVLLPAALPGYLAGLKQGWAFSWRSLMAAELIASSPDLGLGLGTFLENARTNSDMPSVLLGILLILFVGIAIDLLIFSPLERRVLRSRG